MNIVSTFASVVLSLLFVNTLYAEKFIVTSQTEFEIAYNTATTNDSIVWAAGSYVDIYMDIAKDRLFVGAAAFGATIFTGASRVNISGDYVTLEGFQFVGGNIGTGHVINNRGSYTYFHQLNIRAYTCYKYLIIREESQYVTVSHCNFENRINLDDQNILSILVDDTTPGYHKIQYCSFKNFEGTGGDMGIEPIRIGVSTQSDFISRSLVEYCYFTRCNGDGEIISSKARQNVYRYNTFEDNPEAELVLRHGSENIVYGNFFLRGKGGVRIREGQQHYIYNNYFHDLEDRAIYLQNDDSDPLSNINIAFNTIVDCSEVILGGDGNDKPTSVILANNIFTNLNDDLFEEPTGTETWIGNIINGDLGIPLPTTGVTIIDPQLLQNGEGFYGLGDNSPAIDAGLSGFAPLPQFAGMDALDTELDFDIMQQQRPIAISEKDVGCYEYSSTTLLSPIATEENTGPSYNTSFLNSVKKNSVFVKDLLKVESNPVSDRLYLTLNQTYLGNLYLDIFDQQGKKVQTLFDGHLRRGEQAFSFHIGDLSGGLYLLSARSMEGQSGVGRLQTVKFIKQ